MTLTDQSPAQKAHRRSLKVAREDDKDRKRRIKELAAEREAAELVELRGLQSRLRAEAAERRARRT